MLKRMLLLLILSLVQVRNMKVQKLSKKETIMVLNKETLTKTIIILQGNLVKIMQTEDIVIIGLVIVGFTHHLNLHQVVQEVVYLLLPILAVVVVVQDLAVAHMAAAEEGNLN